MILGATHPDLLRREGEATAVASSTRAERSAWRDHVQFVDRFVGRAS